MNKQTNKKTKMEYDKTTKQEKEPISVLVLVASFSLLPVFTYACLKGH